MSIIAKRRSIRKFKKEGILEACVKELLTAGMQAPSALGMRPWEFIVVSSDEGKEKITSVHPYAQMIKDAAVSIIVCGNTDVEFSEGNLVLDCGAAMQNILLKATELGLGGVWIGVYPKKEIQASLKKLFSIPDEVLAIGIAVIGVPDETPADKDRYDEALIHRETY